MSGLTSRERMKNPEKSSQDMGNTVKRSSIHTTEVPEREERERMWYKKSFKMQEFSKLMKVFKPDSRNSTHSKQDKCKKTTSEHI